MLDKPPAKPDLKISLNGFRTYWRTLKAMKGTDLTAATIAWCLFFAVGSLIINIIPHYTEKESLGLTDAQGSNLLGAATLGIAIGGAIVGIGSGHRIRPIFVPIGSVLMGICFFVLGLCDLGYIGVMILLALTGAAAGIFVVPVLALLQHLPVAGFRARCVGTANFMTYMAMSITAVLYWVLTKWISALPPTWFLISGCFMVFVTAWLLLLMPRLRHGSLKESFSTVQDFE